MSGHMNNSDLAIRIEGLSKKYRIYRVEEQATSLSSQIVNMMRSPFSYLNYRLRKPGEDEILWAIKDICFDVPQGQVIGIIGKNGSGKSTLLKVLTRITEPTSGQAFIRGRIGSMLEVGTGFHPELSGRENVYLNGTILGMTRAEIAAKFDEIVDFSGVSKFIDTPVKRYSSGMQVRLAFGVAAFLDPEVLLIDEVLAVGDAEFQRKAMGRMGDITSGEGRTILLVSHNMVAVQSLCDRVIWLQDGQVKMDGDPSEVVRAYMKEEIPGVPEKYWPGDDAPGDARVMLRHAAVMPQDGTPHDLMTLEQDLALVIDVELFEAVNLSVHVAFYDDSGILVFVTGSLTRTYEKGHFRFRCQVPAHLLNDETYVLRIFLNENSAKKIWYGDVLSFVMHDIKREDEWYGKVHGLMRPVLNWTSESIHPDQL
ncbi:ABC transporter ATP-binding protein [Anaerolineales bacterium]